MPAEFVINTYTAQWQRNPDVTRLADGSVVVVWDSFYFEGNKRFYYIAAQRFSADGKKIGEELLLDNDLSGQSTYPSITALSDGGYAVAWETAQGGSLLDQTDVYTRTFDADGTPRGDSIKVHSFSREDQHSASVSATENGGYTITWSSYGGPDVDVWNDVFLRRFDAEGKPLGAGKQVNTFTELDQYSSQATTLSNGNVLVIWDSEHGGNDYPSYATDGVRARIYTQAGKALTREFMVVGENDGFDGVTDIGVAALADGRFVISWFESSIDADNNVFFEVRGQIFGNDGAKQGGSFLVDISDNHVPRHTTIATLDDGSFVIAWDQFARNSEGLDEVFARVYDADGKARGATFRVNPPSGDTSQEFPDIQALDGGGFMVVYQSDYADGDDEAVAGRILGQGSWRADSDTMLWTGTWHARGGDDVVVGTSGADRIFGEHGHDLIAGGGGADWLSGGLGRDVFAYLDLGDSTAARRDTIARFESGRDQIDLSLMNRPDGSAMFHWVGNAAFSGAAGELRFARGVLQGDADGDRTADFAIKVTGDPVLAADVVL
jgi:Peptidase M10 serralysin C terminal